MIAAIRSRPLGAFFLLAYVFSWSYWIPVAMAGGELSHFPGLLGPMLAAFVVTAVVEGGPGCRDLLARMGRWRVPLRWYGAALVPAAVGIAALGVRAVIDGELPSVEDLGTMPGLPELGWLGVFALVLLVNGYGEEVGWRGFAWSRLRQRHSHAWSAGVLALFWAGWHLPAFWLDTGMRGFEPLVGLAAGSVVLGWLYDGAGSSLLIVAVFHALLNMGSATPATEGMTAVAVTAVVIFWAIAILRREGPAAGPA